MLAEQVRESPAHATMRVTTGQETVVGRGGSAVAATCHACGGDTLGGTVCSACGTPTRAAGPTTEVPEAPAPVVVKERPPMSGAIVVVLVLLAVATLGCLYAVVTTPRSGGAVLWFGVAVRPSYVNSVTAIVLVIALVALTTLVGLARPEARTLLVVTATVTAVPAVVGAFGPVLTLSVLPIVVAAVVAMTSDDAQRWFDGGSTGTAPAARILALLTGVGCLVTALAALLTDEVRPGYVAVGSVLVPQGALSTLAPVGWTVAGLVLLVVGVRITRVGLGRKVLATFALGAWVVADLVDVEVVLMSSILLALATVVLVWRTE